MKSLLSDLLAFVQFLRRKSPIVWARENGAWKRVKVVFSKGRWIPREPKT